MEEDALFRKEALESRKNRLYGAVSINTLPQYKVLTLGVSSITVLVILFLVFAEFSEKYLVAGFLDSTKAAARVYPKINGIIVKSYSHQGDRVSKGEKLFLIDTSYAGLSEPNSQVLAKQLQKSKGFIEKEIIYKTQHLRALKRLVKQKYVSAIEYNSKKEELIEAQNKKNSIEMEIIKYKQSRSYLIRAPIDGIVSNVMFKEGQYTQQTRPLMKIIPKDAELVAELFIPVKKAGFLTNSEKVIIRYDAYPYERFGSYAAVIEKVSASIMTDEDEEKPIKLGEPYYKVTARLQKQSVKVYGEEKAIQHGMTFSAVVIGSKRKVWQWILDPLYSYYGMLFV
jgi:membrane fusion protein